MSRAGDPRRELGEAGPAFVAERAGVDGRTLDQALWQWSKEQSSGLEPERPR